MCRYIDEILKFVPEKDKLNLHACYAIFDEENPWVDGDKIEPKHIQNVIHLHCLHLMKKQSAFCNSLLRQGDKHEKNSFSYNSLR